MSESRCKRVVVTGAGGLLGFHCRALLEARNGEKLFRGKSPVFEVVEVSRDAFSDSERLEKLVVGADIVLHLAGINRASPESVRDGNVDIAKKLVDALKRVNAKPHLVYSNSTHSDGDTPYGIGKRIARDVMQSWSSTQGALFSDVVLPHLFGEGGVPDYNTVTATLCDRVYKGEQPEIHEGAKVELLHAGAAAEFMLDAGVSDRSQNIRIPGLHMQVQELYKRIKHIATQLESDIYPDLSDAFTLRLFNTYRHPILQLSNPRILVVQSDQRGGLFEVARSEGAGQTFLSWTLPGVERGNHFHRRKVERFVVLEGEAKISVRCLFNRFVESYTVTGDNPVAVDMPTLHTHSIINTGDVPLLTLFWCNEIFDPTDTDTFMQPVVK